MIGSIDMYKCSLLTKSYSKSLSHCVIVSGQIRVQIRSGPNLWSDWTPYMGGQYRANSDQIVPDDTLAVVTNKSKSSL